MYLPRTWWKSSSGLATKNVAVGRPVAPGTTSSNLSLCRGAPNTMPGVVRNAQLPVWPGLPILPSSTRTKQGVALTLAYTRPHLESESFRMKAQLFRDLDDQALIRVIQTLYNMAHASSPNTLPGTLNLSVLFSFTFAHDATPAWKTLCLFPY